MSHIVFASRGKLKDKPRCVYVAVSDLCWPSSTYLQVMFLIIIVSKMSGLLTALEARGWKCGVRVEKEPRSPYPLSLHKGWDLTSGVDLCSRLLKKPWSVQGEGLSKINWKAYSPQVPHCVLYWRENCLVSGINQAQLCGPRMLQPAEPNATMVQLLRFAFCAEPW